MAAPQTSPDYNNPDHNRLCIRFDVVNGRPQDQAICIFPKNGCYNIFPPAPPLNRLIYYFCTSLQVQKVLLKFMFWLLLFYCAILLPLIAPFFFEITYLKTKAGDDSWSSNEAAPLRPLASGCHTKASVQDQEVQ
jgi:hypothetical protein